MKRIRASSSPAGAGWAVSDPPESLFARDDTQDDANEAGGPRTSTELPSSAMDAAGMHAASSYVNLAQLAMENVLLHRLQQTQALARPSQTRVEPGAVQPTAGLEGGAEEEQVHPTTASSWPAAEAGAPGLTLFDVALPLVRQGYVATVDDTFTRCFKSKKKVHWNWNAYLAPAWAFGVFFRYCVLFPLRLMCLLLGFVVVGITFPLVKLLGRVLPKAVVKPWEVILIRTLATAFVASWSGVIRIHGLRPTPRVGGKPFVFVANHSSMIDFIILLQLNPIAVVGQKHSGWVGFLQDHLLSSLNCVWFDRGESRDKKAAAERLKRHVADPENIPFPILVFPEGTCVNNEYVVQFKKFVFELGVPIQPVAINYSKMFVDAYWNSKEQSFAQHLAKLMCSWAVVCDIWFMDPQEQREGESGAAFATRVQRMIAARASLKATPWDGYMKYWRPGDRFITARQKNVAEDIERVEGLSSGGTSSPEADA